MGLPLDQNMPVFVRTVHDAAKRVQALQKRLCRMARSQNIRIRNSGISQQHPFPEAAAVSGHEYSTFFRFKQDAQAVFNAVSGTENSDGTMRNRLSVGHTKKHLLGKFYNGMSGECFHCPCFKCNCDPLGNRDAWVAHDKSYIVPFPDYLPWLQW